jgi:PDZ domain-containing secreted protein
MYPNGSIQINSNTDLYTKNKNPISPPIGVPLTTNNTDTITFQNYINGGSLDKSYGLTNVTSVQKQQLSQLQTKLNLLSKQISGLNTRFQTGTNTAENQSKTNVKGIGNYLINLNKNNTKIANFPSSNIDNILGDSDIVVLQKNYDYLFWSILAAGSVLIAMNLTKSNS